MKLFPGSQTNTRFSDSDSMLMRTVQFWVAFTLLCLSCAELTKPDEYFFAIGPRVGPVSSKRPTFRPNGLKRISSIIYRHREPAINRNRTLGVGLAGEPRRKQYKKFQLRPRPTYNQDNNQQQHLESTPTGNTDYAEGQRSSGNNYPEIPRRAQPYKSRRPEGQQPLNIGLQRAPGVQQQEYATQPVQGNQQVDPQLPPVEIPQPPVIQHQQAPVIQPPRMMAPQPRPAVHVQAQPQQQTMEFQGQPMQDSVMQGSVHQNQEPTVFVPSQCNQHAPVVQQNRFSQQPPVQQAVGPPMVFHPQPAVHNPAPVVQPVPQPVPQAPQQVQFNSVPSHNYQQPQPVQDSQYNNNGLNLPQSSQGIHQPEVNQQATGQRSMPVAVPPPAPVYSPSVQQVTAPAVNNNVPNNNVPVSSVVQTQPPIVNQVVTSSSSPPTPKVSTEIPHHRPSKEHPATPTAPPRVTTSTNADNNKEKYVVDSKDEYTSIEPHHHTEPSTTTAQIPARKSKPAVLAKQNKSFGGSSVHLGNVKVIEDQATLQFEQVMGNTVGKEHREAAGPEFQSSAKDTSPTLPLPRGSSEETPGFNVPPGIWIDKQDGKGLKPMIKS